jgi:hypothetical protein
VSFPFDLYSVAVSNSHFPCHSQGHCTVRLLRDSVWATCLRTASSGYHAGCYQKRTNLTCRWPVCNPTTFVTDEEKSGSSTLQKRRSVKTAGLAVRIFPATVRTFMKDTALSEHGRGTARHGRGTAWARHAMCESALSLISCNAFYTCCMLCLILFPSHYRLL